MRFLARFLILALTLPVLAQQKAAAHHTNASSTTRKSEAAPGLPSEETVNSFLQQTFGYDSNLTWKIASIVPSEAQGLTRVTVVIASPQGQQLSVFYVTEDGRHAVAGDLMPFGAHPFEPARKELANGITGPAEGPANAPATVVEFSDLQCPHCKEAQPVLEKLMGEEPNVRLVFQNFPLAIPAHDWAAKGAAYADCVGRASNDAFWKFIHSVYEKQSEITAASADEKLAALADQAGAKGTEIATCAAQPETAARIEQSVALGKELKVSSTPTLFVNGRRIESLSALPYDVFKKLVDFAVKEGSSTQQATK